MKMTDRAKRFCDEYLIDMNGKQAAIRAGYAPKYADRQAYTLLQTEKVKQYIAERMEEKNKLLIASQDEILQYLTTVLRGESESEIVIVEGCGDGISEAKRLKKQPDEKERLRAAELLAKRYGLLNDKLNITGAVPVVISGENDLED